AGEAERERFAGQAQVNGKPAVDVEAHQVGHAEGRRDLSDRTIALGKRGRKEGASAGTAVGAEALRLAARDVEEGEEQCQGEDAHDGETTREHGSPRRMKMKC